MLTTVTKNNELLTTLDEKRSNYPLSAFQTEDSLSLERTSEINSRNYLTCMHDIWHHFMYQHTQNNSGFSLLNCWSANSLTTIEEVNEMYSYLPGKHRIVLFRLAYCLCNQVQILQFPKECILLPCPNNPECARQYQSATSLPFKKNEKKNL